MKLSSHVMGLGSWFLVLGSWVLGLGSWVFLQIKSQRTQPIVYGSVVRFLLYGDHDGDVYATGGQVEVSLEPNVVCNESKIFLISKIDRTATNATIKKFIDNELAKLPDKLRLDWPEGNCWSQKAVQPAGTPLGPLNVEILNKKGEAISRLPSSNQVVRKLVLELRVVWHGPNGDQEIHFYIAQHSAKWAFWFKAMGTAALLTFSCCSAHLLLLLRSPSPAALLTFSCCSAHLLLLLCSPSPAAPLTFSCCSANLLLLLRSPSPAAQLCSPSPAAPLCSPSPAAPLCSPSPAALLTFSCCSAHLLLLLSSAHLLLLLSSAHLLLLLSSAHLLLLLSSAHLLLLLSSAHLLLLLRSAHLLLLLRSAHLLLLLCSPSPAALLTFSCCSALLTFSCCSALLTFSCCSALLTFSCCSALLTFSCCSALLTFSCCSALRAPQHCLLLSNTENLTKLGKYTLELKTVLSESNASAIGGKPLPSYKLNFTITEGKAERFTVGAVNPALRVGVAFDMVLTLMDAFDHPAPPPPDLTPQLTCRGLDVSYEKTTSSGTQFTIHGVKVHGKVANYHCKPHDLKVALPGLVSSPQTLKISLLPGMTSPSVQSCDYTL
ncbi:Structural maintenance of chromosomes flexible hinge domain-containing protein 1 [Merluccius polli]|uniref:Structural maintenance of chromosomes flexible hinge domain-containing protein 1 n=1 Tax=Merluccius polli TaxID=89951 RepID=A0AA47NPD0_MERPO|nr:Structural maintenance of chromosomes flexible hinge domain-containing protein 1 [Merluccius polli]